MNNLLKVLLIGYKGRMGRSITDCAKKNNATIFAACDINDEPNKFVHDCDVIIDFSHYSNTLNIAKLAIASGKPLVIGTTGHNSKLKKEIKEVIFNKLPVVWAGNYSIGITVLNYLTSKTSLLLKNDFEAEISEIHHNQKKDSPSGTAERLIEIIQKNYSILSNNIKHGRSGQSDKRIAKEIGVHSIRGGDVVGDHTVHFFTEGERLELKHTASDRKIFANGALFAANWAISAAVGLYDMNDVLGINDLD